MLILLPRQGPIVECSLAQRLFFYWAPGTTVVHAAALLSRQHYWKNLEQYTVLPIEPRPRYSSVLQNHLLRRGQKNWGGRQQQTIDKPARVLISDVDVVSSLM